jgi:hypothetical protein
MSLFTLHLAYRGGNYIKQVEAETVKDAVIAWMPLAQKEKYGEFKLPTLEEEFKHNDNWPVPLKGLVNAWCTSLFGGRDFALLNIVKTVGVDSQP